MAHFNLHNLYQQGFEALIVEGLGLALTLLNFSLYQIPSASTTSHFLSGGLDSYKLVKSVFRQLSTTIVFNYLQLWKDVL